MISRVVDKKMTELNESRRPSSRQNPLIWLAVIVIGLILFLFVSGDRNASLTNTDTGSTTADSPVGEVSSTADANPVGEVSSTADANPVGEASSTADANPVGEASSTADANPDVSGSTSVAGGTIDRSLLIPPGMRARQYIEQLRIEGTPYPFPRVFEKAEAYLRDGSLADAHLLYFFAAREGHLPAIMKMGEMADPNLFLAENSLLDHADAIQAYKWYRKAELLGHEVATDRVDDLQQWAIAEARLGDSTARQLLLNF